MFYLCDLAQSVSLLYIIDIMHIVLFLYLIEIKFFIPKWLFSCFLKSSGEWDMNWSSSIGFPVGCISVCNTSFIVLEILLIYNPRISIRFELVWFVCFKQCVKIFFLSTNVSLDPMLFIYLCLFSRGIVRVVSDYPRK